MGRGDTVCYGHVFAIIQSLKWTSHGLFLCDFLKIFIRPLIKTEYLIFPPPLAQKLRMNLYKTEGYLFAGI